MSKQIELLFDVKVIAEDSCFVLHGIIACIRWDVAVGFPTERETP